jgi:hypothetical protein
MEPTGRLPLQKLDPPLNPLHPGHRTNGIWGLNIGNATELIKLLMFH